MHLINLINSRPLSTTHGVIQFRENRFKLLLLFDKKHNLFSRIKKLSDNNIWPTTWFGLVRIYKEDIRFFTSRNSINSIKQLNADYKYVVLPEEIFDTQNEKIDNVSETIDGSLWIILRNGKIVWNKDGISKLSDSSSWMVFPNILQKGKNSVIKQLSDKTIWIINDNTSEGINCFDGKQWQSFSLKDFGGNNIIILLYRNFKIIFLSLLIDCYQRLSPDLSG